MLLFILKVRKSQKENYLVLICYKIIVSIPKDFVATKILSIKIEEVIGLLGVTNKKQQSKKVTMTVIQKHIILHDISERGLSK